MGKAVDKRVLIKDAPGGERKKAGEALPAFIRTDLAVEFVAGCKTRNVTKTLKRTDVTVDDALSKKLKKPEGKYITVESDAVRENKRFEFDRIALELSDALSSLTCGSGNCLIVGLGNPNLTADALGKFVSERLMITRHLDVERDTPKISCICPNVLGVTGIESFDIVKGVVERVKPDCVIVIDSLAGASSGRIASAFQVSDSGITPGSGVSNHRVRFDKQSLGAAVVSVGVPLVVYASTLIYDALGGREAPYDDKIGSMIVTPKDIDLYVEDCAEIISKAINLTFFGNGNREQRESGTI